VTIRWTADRATSWSGDERLDHDVRVAARWRLRLISDQLSYGVGRAPVADFHAVIDSDLEIWLRPFGSGQRLERSASGPGIDAEIVEDVTLGTTHEVTIRVRPSDDEVARWSCSCSVQSRGRAPLDRAREAAEEHQRAGRAHRPSRSEAAVAQGADGRWAQVQIPIARRFRLRSRSDFSPVKVHKLGLGEEFELAIDGRLGLWGRLMGSEGALRRDESGRGLTLLVLEDA
jgi:hypothetical protein